MPSQSPLKLNPISCDICRRKKVRCSRALPKCDRCQAHDLNCTFPQRVKRRSTAPLTSLGRSDAGINALSAILQRSQRVEKYCTAVPNLSFDPSARTDSTAPNSTQNVLSKDQEINVATMLREAVSQVQKLRLQTFSKSVITQHVHIPPKLAKTWIKAYFSHMHTDMFITLVNEKLIEAIPDLLESPHTYLDPAVLVVYYNVLYHGCVFGPKITGPLQAADFTSALYVCCLRSLPLWQREATGTSTDLIAALLMSHTAAGSFDDTLSWKMHKRACNYAQRLNLHKLDAPSVDNVSNDSALDADRKHFWELIQLDFLFRLLFDRPPVLTESTKSWNINLPWLSDIEQPDLSAVSIAAFLVGARLCFVLSQFFHTLESADQSEKSTLHMTESYCSEINQIFLEYDLEQRIIESAAEGQTFRLWRLSDTALMGYNYIILMIRKVEFSQNTDASDSGACERETLDSPLAVDAARRMLHVVRVLLDCGPSPNILHWLLGIYRIYVPYACLLNSILYTSDVGTHFEDTQLLGYVGEAIMRMAKDDRDFIPLSKILQDLNTKIQYTST